MDNNCCNSTNYGSRLRVHGSEDEQAYWDEELDYIVFDSVYNSTGGGSSNGSNGDQPLWAKIKAAITLIAIIAFFIYGWYKAT